MRYTVALTGGIGSGKSTVADAFADLGITVIDADIIAHQMVEPGQPALNAIAEHLVLNLSPPTARYVAGRCVSVFFRIRKKKPGLTLCFIP